MEATTITSPSTAAGTPPVRGMRGFDRAYLERLDGLVELVEDWSRLPAQPVVSVWMIAFNQEAYIRQALDGILMQQTSFAFEVVIGDDCSTDQTRSILLAYQQQHADRIRLRLAKENLYSQKLKQSIGVFGACRGRYIALCEGDDYWTDPEKLEKQVALLESNPDLSGSFHRVHLLDEATRKLTPQKLRAADRCTLDDLLGGNFINTASMVIRSGLINPFPQFFYTVPFGDWALFVLQAEHGDIGYIDDIMAVYRRHDAGILTGAAVQVKESMNRGAFDAIRSHFGKDKAAIIARGHARSLVLIATVAANEGNLTLARKFYRQSVAEDPAWRNGDFVRKALLWVRLNLPFGNWAAMRLRAMR